MRSGPEPRPAERDAEENLFSDAHGLAADVVRVFDRADEPAAAQAQL